MMRIQIFSGLHLRSHLTLVTLSTPHPVLSRHKQVFGGKPEAINLWIGDERSVTSFHKDHFENMYGVIRGTKVCIVLYLMPSIMSPSIVLAAV